MSLDSATTTTTLTAGAKVSHSASVRAGSPNEAVIDAIRAHHALLAEQLRIHTDAVLAAAQAGECTRERDELYRWYRTELMPHAVAEEQTLYDPASELEGTRLLIYSMLAEHRYLENLIAELALTRQPVAVAGTAAAARAVFTVHLNKENDLLLPALDKAGLDLPAMLDGMHEILGHPQHHLAADSAGNESRVDSAGSGCGDTHDDGGPGAAAPLQLATAGTVPDNTELDVRTLPHGQRHEIIFAKLDGLQPRQVLVIVNDHDPKPLRYQTSALWPDRFDWSYLQAGPEVWRVAITRAG